MPSPVGDWLVKDGYGTHPHRQLRRQDVGHRRLGKGHPGFDNENPDPAKKGRPLLGMPIVIGHGA